MVGLKRITMIGNQLRAELDDGTNHYAVPTGQGIWVKSLTSGGAPPGPGPGSGDFMLPFPWSSVWDYNEFQSPSRPTHAGIDMGPGLGVGAGDSIRAAGAGVVEFAGWGGDWGNSPGFGNLVVINHGDFNGSTLKTLYAHMATAPAVSTSASVVKGQHLGPVGETGNAIGAHLHWETWVNGVPINPRTFMAAYGE